MAAGGGAARRCWRSGAGLSRAVRGVCGSARATAALRAEELAERLRKSEEQQREIPKDPTQRWLRELAAMSQQLQQVHPNVLAKILKQRTLYQNEEIVVIDKPYGLPVHGGPGIKNCIADVLPILAKMLENMRAEPLHLCHRLDKETTGVMVLARSKEAAEKIRLLFKTRQVEKIYWAIVLGDPDPVEGVVEIPIVEKEVKSHQSHYKVPRVSGGWPGGEGARGSARRARGDALPPAGCCLCLLPAAAAAHHRGEAPDPGSPGLWLGMPHPGGSQILTLEQTGAPETS
ncbi:pseudouridylate synthase RPUSD4, mitochondrial isoform X2 [Melospiza melodia melodia]|uniref:pseudouridylate synthase RPUSD4, mitochondrial isoform X2 n=1 Tax=Melospiza melodia melodia TaxID=1914991 RepID=UPI002FD5A6C6